MTKKLVLLLCLACSVSLAESISRFTECSISSPVLNVSTTGTGSCSVPFGDPGNHSVSATASGSFSLVTAPPSFNKLNLNATTVTPCPSFTSVPCSHFASSATAVASDRGLFIAAGFPRLGTLEYQITYTTSPAPGGSLRGDATANITLTQAGVSKKFVFPSSPFNTSTVTGTIPNWILGIPFALDASAQSRGTQSGVDEPVTVSSDVTFQFRVNQNGNFIPVDIMPEPSSMLPCATVLAGLAIIAIRRRRNARPSKTIGGSLKYTVPDPSLIQLTLRGCAKIK